jgi:hypothetical protein
LLDAPSTVIVKPGSAACALPSLARMTMFE